jgi:hypothetical protein
VSDDFVNEAGERVIAAVPVAAAPAAPVEVEVATVAAGLAATPEFDPTVRVKVRVVRGNAEVVTTCNHPLPEYVNIVKRLEKQWLAQLSRYDKKYGHLNCVIYNYRNTIPLSAWTAAISQAVVNQLMINHDTEAEVVMPLGMQGGYLAIGGYLCQLNVVQSIKTGAALTVTKRRIMEQTKGVAAAIVRNANTTAAGVLSAAREVKQRAEQEAAVLRSNVPPPQWAVAAGLMVKNIGGSGSAVWCVGMMLQIRFAKFVITASDATQPHYVREISWEVPRWRELPYVSILAWAKLRDAAGHYDTTACFLDPMTPYLPHMTTAASCMQLGDAPELLNSTGALGSLRNSITRCFQVVNLGSLYNNPYNWREKFADFIPEELRVPFSRDNALDVVRAMAVDRVRALQQQVAEAAAQAAQQQVATPPADDDGELAAGVWHVGVSNGGGR